MLIAVLSQVGCQESLALAVDPQLKRVSTTAAVLMLAKRSADIRRHKQQQRCGSSTLLRLASHECHVRCWHWSCRRRALTLRSLYHGQAVPWMTGRRQRSIGR